MSTTYNKNPVKIQIMKVIICFLLCINFVSSSSSQSSCKNAVDFLVEKYKTYNIIAMDEGPHGRVETHKFFRDLVQNEKLNKIVQYVIIEFASTRYQATLDRFINGEKVPLSDLQKVWRETTQSHTPLVEMPVYFKLLESIRKINLKRPLNNRIRVLGGDPGIDWQKITKRQEYFPMLSQRDVLPSQLAIKYGIDSLKKVLIIFGGAHLTLMGDEKKDSTRWTIPYFINRKYPNKIFSIGCYITKNDKSGSEPKIARNSICQLSNDSLGNKEFTYDFDPKNPRKLHKLYNAMYYIGPSGEWHEDRPATIDAIFWDELNRRSQILWEEGIDPKLKKKSK